MNDFQPSHLVATNQHSFQLKTFLLLVESPLFTGWWYTYPFEKYEFVSWDDGIPNWMERHNPFMFQTTNQLYIYIHVYIEKYTLTAAHDNYTFTTQLHEKPVIVDD